MKYEKYLCMDATELYRHLISDINLDPPSGELIAEELSSTERYQNDFEFRAFIETGRGISYNLSAQYNKAISHFSSLIERVKALELWQLVSINQNYLGNAYLSLEIFELALESYYNVIKTEEKHHILYTTFAAYNNIAIIYSSTGDYKKSCEHLEKALEALEKGGSEQPRYLSKLIHCLSNLLVALCLLENRADAKAVWEKIRKYDIENTEPASKYSYHFACMYYEYLVGNYEAGREHFQKGYVMFENNPFQQAAMLNDYLKRNSDYNLDFEFYADGLKLAEKIINFESPFVGSLIYGEILKYYRKTDNKEKITEISEKYIDSFESTLNEKQKRQGQSLQIVEDFLRNKESVEDIAARNIELKLVAEEALRHKNASQEAYHRIEIINELGKNMTSSLDLEKVIDLIYKNLRENIPLDSFILMVADEEEQELRSVAFYENNILQPEFTVSQHNPDSMFAECFRTGKIILSENIHDDPRYKNRNFIQVGIGEIPRSALYMPLKVEDKFIGACSIQNNLANIYSEKDILFLEELLPYLAIALNNAIRSWVLKKEILSHLETQEELKAANDKLERLSSLDGLTQISNRRDFEFRILGLLEESQDNDAEIAVFMFDIDNFKLYNDTYGHLEGDEALKSIAHIVRENLDTVDGLSARFGGEEFIGACAGLSKEEVYALGEQIRSDVFEMGIENKAAPLGQLSVSVGIAFSQSLDVSHKSSIMRWADISLYQAKNSGKNKVVLKEIGPDDEAPSRLELELNMQQETAKVLQ
ncbi:MAG: diguanylate cyclase [Peptostreptococcaceae bacterium]|nr:diguanylate cyclase [Peptostreptococcaceae bacterium]